MIQTQVAIIGAGPIGIELAIALKRNGIPYLHFDAGQIGATMFWWPPGTRWFSSNDRISIAGVPLQTSDQSKATREEYLAYLRSIVLQFDLSINTYEPVVSIQPETPAAPPGHGNFLIRTRPSRGEQAYLARNIVLATGGTALPRMLNVPGEDLPHVSHYMGDPHKYFRKRVLVVGGRNSAVEAALRIHTIGAEVAISYRGDSFDPQAIKYWLHPEIVALTRSGKIRGFFNTTVKEIRPAEVILADRLTGNTLAVPADFVLLLVGYLADMSLFRMAGVKLAGENEIPVYNEQAMRTNVPGVYVAGTAVGGTQDHYRVFLENCHIHVDRIIAALTGTAPPPPPELPARPET